jgi:hypothetical protein
MDPIVKDCVRVSTGREHEDSLENSRQDRTASDIEWLDTEAGMELEYKVKLTHIPG